MAAQLNIVGSIRERARPADCALVQGGRQISYGELLAQCEVLSRRLSGEFKSAGRRARVGVHFPSGLDYISVALAVLDAGFCFVPVPEELADPEKVELVKRTALDGLMVMGDHASWIPENARFADEFPLHEFRLALYHFANPQPCFPEERF